MPITVLALGGSLRRGSFNGILVDTLPSLAPDGVTVAKAPPIGGIPLYNADLQQEQGFPADVTALADAIRAADGVIVVTPEYNYSIPGVLKNAIDWVSRVPNQPFANKPVALQSAAGGLLGGARAQYHLRQVMVFLDALVLNKPEVFVTMAKSKFDEEKRTLTDEPTREVIKSQLTAFSAFIAKVGG